MIHTATSPVVHRLLSTLLTPLARAALVRTDGSAIYVAPLSPVDIATLPHTAGLCQKYLNLGEGEFAITNDPYSGGSTLAEFTLIRGLRLNDQTVLLVRRLSFGTRLPVTGKLADEGVRVPPTPITTSPFQLNRELLQAIASHPLAPQGLVAAIETAAGEMNAVAKTISEIAADPRSILNRESLDAYIDDGRKSFEMLMSKLPLGTVNVASQTSSGEVIKLQLRIGEDRVFFDFGGSDSSSTFALTDLVTFGACWSALVGSFGSKLPINVGSLQHVQVSAPAKTMLSATAPVGTLRGVSEGVALVGRLVNQALSKLRPVVEVSGSSPGDARFELVFSDVGRRVSIRIPCGSGASVESDGLDASPWLDPHPVCPATEFLRLENEAGLEVIGAGLNKGSGGKGKKRGGLGASLTFKVTQACEFHWHEPAINQRLEGLSGGRAGGASKIQIRRPGSKAAEDVLIPSGSMKLSAGDEVILFGSGGAGFGDAAETEES